MDDSTEETTGPTYYFQMDSASYSLVLIGGDERLAEERIVAVAQLLVRGWNRRFEARRCEHEWGEEYALALLPGTEALCTRCGTTRSGWEQQKREEALTVVI